jgi:thioredoxin 1
MFQALNNFSPMVLKRTRFLILSMLMVAGCSQPPPAMVEVDEANHDRIVAGSLPVVLDFGAPWCSPCAKLSPTLERLAHQFQGQIVVGVVNVDRQESLARRYDISSLPTLCYLKGGELVEVQTEDFSAGTIEAKMAALVQRQ